MDKEGIKITERKEIIVECDRCSYTSSLSDFNEIRTINEYDNIIAALRCPECGFTIIKKINKDIYEKYVGVTKTPNIEYLDKFVKEMIKVLDEKYEKYQDSWKDTNSGDLRAKLKEQVENLNNIITSNTEFKKPGYEEKVRRILIHIANYCCFLYDKFGE